MIELNPLEKVVLGIVKAGPASGMNRDEVTAAVMADGKSTYKPNTVRCHGLKSLSEKGLVVKVGMRDRQIVWLDVERAGANAAPHDQPETKPNGGGGFTFVQPGEVNNLRRELATYIEKVIEEDGGFDASWLARCLLRDWDVRQRS